MIATQTLMPLQDNKTITAELVTQMLGEECDAMARQLGQQRFERSKFPQAKQLLEGTIQGKEYADFLTNLCYDAIVTPVGPQSKM